MTADGTTGIAKAEQQAVASMLAEHLRGPVAIDVWSRKESPLLRPDRDPCTHCDDVVKVARQLASLHPGLSITLYDLDRHAQRAAEAGIDRPPVTVLRGRYGRELRMAGLWAGLLFPAVFDCIIMLGAGATPLAEASKQALAELPRDMPVEVLGAAYDPYSAQMLALLGALAVESKRVRAQFVEVVEFPRLAASRAVEQLPVTLVEGKRYVGMWEEADLVEQLRRLGAADESPVARERVLSSPYHTEAELARMAAEQGAPQQPARTPGGLYLPSR